jgi:CHAT domain-containing protein
LGNNKFPQSDALAQTLECRAYLVDALGRPAEAGALFLRALAIRQKRLQVDPSIGSSDVAFAMVSLGAVSMELGDLDRAENYYHAALSLKRNPNQSDQYIGLALNGLANVLWLRRELPKAAYYGLLAFRVQQRRESGSFDSAQTLTTLSGVFRELGDLTTAETFAKRAIRIFEKRAPICLDSGLALNNLADVFVSSGRLKLAIYHYQRALAVLSKMNPSGHMVATALRGLGDAYSRSGDLVKAEQNYRDSLAIWDKIAPGSELRAEVLLALGGVLRREHRFRQAAGVYQTALTALETLDSHIGGGESGRADFRANHQNPYRELVDLLVQQGQSEHAFEVLERSRARSFVEMLNSGHIDIRKGVDPALLEQQRSLQRKLTEKSNQRIRLLSGPHTEEQVKQLDKEMADLISQRQEVDGQIQSTSPIYAALTQPQPLSAKEIQQQLLDPETVLLEYSLGDDHSYLFILTTNALHSYELPSRKKIEGLARRVYALLTTRDRPVRGETTAQKQIRLRSNRQAYLHAATDLSRIILAPAANELQEKRLLVVSDGALAYIPFAALPDADGAPLTFAHEIVNLPSASALAMLRQQELTRTSPAKVVAVLADPVFSKDDPRVPLGTHPTRRRSSKERTEGAQEESQGTENRLNPVATAPSPQVSSLEADLPAYLLSRSIDDVKPSARLRLYRLPFTRQEAQAIASTVGPGQGLEALDFQASRAIATGPDLAQYRIVHFATHGLLDSRHPELSGLVLSLVDEYGQPQNGFLELQDIYNLNLSADLVVLSACETALGKEVDGEGLVGLTRGFMYAGTTRVLASLWRVDDEATAQLMKKFYQGILQERESPAHALRAAQLWMLSQKRWQQPYYWAGFVLQGEWK